MKDLDIYKVLIIACLVLAPVTLWGLFQIEGELEVAEKAIKREKGRSGYLYRIGEYKRKSETVKKNQRQNERLQNAGVFFQTKIRQSAGGGLELTEFSIGEEDAKPVGGRSKAEDVEVPITFGSGNDRKQLTKDYIHALAFNVESHAPVWRLRQLKMKNVELDDLKKDDVPPDESKDSWKVERLVFARRRPRADDRR